MICIACKPRRTIFLLLAAFALVAFAQTAWAASADSPDPASRLIALGDFNRDGIADLAEAILPTGNPTGAGSLLVSLGQPDGSYKPAVTRAALGHTPRSIVAGDFNGDGIPDVIVGDDDGALTLFLGDGTGNLASVGDLAHFDSVTSIAVADFNHDGIPDLAVSDWRGSTVTVLLGAGDGSFRRKDSFRLRMPGTVASVTAADFNGDHIPDLAVVYTKDDASTYEVMLGNGDGTFTDAPDLSFVKDPNSSCPT
jgi:hypothetical protein